MTTLKMRWGKRLAATIVSTAAFLLLVEVLAWRSVRSERAERAYLGDRLFTVVRGQGPPVVFIAGLEGSTREWGDGFESLQSDHTLIYVDLFGFGRSQWPLHTPALEDHVTWLRRTLVSVGATGNVTFIAHSFGTIVAAHYAARYPSDVEHLYLLGTPVFFSVADGDARIRHMSHMAALFALHPILGRESCMTMCAFRPFFRKLLPLFAREVSAESLADAVLHDWPSIKGAIQDILLRIPIAPAVERLGRKVTLIHGSRDAVTDVSRIVDLARATGAYAMIVDTDHQGYVHQKAALIVKVVRQIS